MQLTLIIACAINLNLFIGCKYKAWIWLLKFSYWGLFQLVNHYCYGVDYWLSEVLLVVFLVLFGTLYGSLYLWYWFSFFIWNGITIILNLHLFFFLYIHLLIFLFLIFFSLMVLIIIWRLWKLLKQVSLSVCIDLGIGIFTMHLGGCSHWFVCYRVSFKNIITSFPTLRWELHVPSVLGYTRIKVWSEEATHSRSLVR